MEADSGGAMHNTFEEEELSSGVCGVALGTLYMRGRWRAAPTLLNDSRLFRDAEGAPLRYTRLFRINDIVGYAYLHEWDAEVDAHLWRNNSFLHPTIVLSSGCPYALVYAVHFVCLFVCIYCRYFFSTNGGLVR